MESRGLMLFVSSIKSEETKKMYLYQLSRFVKYYKLRDMDSILTIEPKQLQIMIEDYVMYLGRRISGNSFSVPINALCSLIELNDITLNWKKIKKLIPSRVKLTGEEAWTTENIRLMLAATKELRNKALIHFLASTGVRIGAITNMKLRHLTEMPFGCKSVLVNDDTTEEYMTFLTPEASSAIDQYLAQRQKDGELLKPESPLFRVKYQVGVEKTKSCSTQGLVNILFRIVKGIRSEKVRGRFKIQQNHGFRKRFNTILKADNSINSNIAEKLMGHKNGLDGVYFKPTKEQLFEEFKKAIPRLTIDEAIRLRDENKLKDEKIKELESDKDKRIADYEFRLSSNERMLKTVLDRLDSKN